MATVSEIAEKIRAVGVRLTSQMNSHGWSTSVPFSQTVGAGAIGVSAESVVAYGEIVARRVERLTKQQLDIDDFGEWLGEIADQLDMLQFSAMSQGHHVQFLNAMSVLQMIDAAIPAIPPKEPKVNWEDLREQKSLLPRDLSARLRSVEARLRDLEPRTKDISGKISDIEAAHEAADQLPTDLAELAERRQELANLIDDAQSLAKQVSEDAEIVASARDSLLADIDLADTRIKDTLSSANAVLTKCEHALRGATAVGLSKAFEARKKALSKAGAAWTVGLAVALLAAVWIGWERVDSLKEVLSGDKPTVVVVVNAILAIIGIGAPVWFAWLSTKQLGMTFRLAEDYAFKASVAQAYEGYRTEASEIDDALKARLFAAALDRFEEAPIRLVDPTYHGSPLQDAMSNSNFGASSDASKAIGQKIRALVPSKSEESEQGRGRDDDSEEA
ncbi:MAG: hypothetical protein K2Q29_07720 [Sphingomonadales bacterium]|nr:hypothetical protein [Sphingomonadales bacterium]